MRKIFDTVEELVLYLNETKPTKQTPFIVRINGKTLYTLSNNSDQAIAGAARKLGAEVETMPILALLKESKN